MSFLHCRGLSSNNQAPISECSLSLSRSLLIRQRCQCLLNDFEPFVIRHGCWYLIGEIGVQGRDLDESVSFFTGPLSFIAQQFAPEHQQGQDVQRVRFAWLRGEPLKKALQRFAGNLLWRGIAGNVFCGRSPPAEKIFRWSGPVFCGNILSDKQTVLSR